MGVKLVSRKIWGAEKPKSRAFLAPRQYNVFIHHSAYPALSPNATIKEESARMRDIQRQHMNAGYADIAYHFVFFPSGRVYKGRGWFIRGGATRGYNNNSYAFCFDGNFENSRPTRAAIKAARCFRKKGARRRALRIRRRQVVRGHRDVGATACPGKNLYARLQRILKNPRRACR